MITSNLTILALLAAACGAGYYIYKRISDAPKPVVLTHKKFTGTLQFDDVVAKLRSMELKKDHEIVFVGKSTNETLRKLIVMPELEPGYETIIVGIMNVSDGTIDATRSHIVSATCLDEKFVNIFEDQTLVKLV